MIIRVEREGAYLGLFPLSREVRLRDCRIEATATEAYGIAQTITGLLDMDGVSVAVRGESGAALGEAAVEVAFRLIHCKLTAALHSGCILGTADENTSAFVSDTEYDECEEDAFNMMLEDGCPEPE